MPLASRWTRAALKWLLDHGAHPNCRDHGYTISGHAYPGTALDYIIASYGRSPQELSACIEILLEAGGATKYDAPGVLPLLRGRLDSLAEQTDADPTLVNRPFPDWIAAKPVVEALPFTEERSCMWPQSTATLAAAALLLNRGADVNARAAVDEAGVGGHTALFHAVTQFDDGGLPVTQLLIERGADLAVRVKLPGDYERPGEIVECTALGYALLFGGSRQRRTVTLLRERGAVE